MEEKLTHIMDHYSEALEELMGAQGYAKKAWQTKDQSVKSAYIRMARQELEHADGLKAMAEAEAKTDPMLAIVWHKLHEHLDTWKASIMEKLKKTESH